MAIIKIEDIAFVRFRAPDLDHMRAFLEDFGLSCSEEREVLYAAATDGSPFVHVTERGGPRFVGLGFQAASVADVETLADFEGVPVEKAAGPGGGLVVRLTDPDGNAIDVVAGQERREVRPLSPTQPFNSLSEKQRLSMAVQIDKAPSHVRRLGHAVVLANDFATSCAWYKDRLGFIASDTIEAAPNAPIGVFMRADRGDTPTDHHTLAIFASPEGPGFDHAAFEVEGFDDLMKGHSYLKDRDRDHAWGVGRHKLGSQIFDYWKDPWGNKLEHWTDGDLQVASDEVGIRSVEEALGTHWGPPHPLLSGRS